MGFKDALLTILIFNAIGVTPVAYFSTFGARTGMRQMVLTRYSFGYYPAMLIAVLNIVSCIGWSAVNVVVGAQVIHAISDKIPLEAGIGIIAG
jgi:purine-cytosine permease-like protein